MRARLGFLAVLSLFIPAPLHGAFRAASGDGQPSCSTAVASAPTLSRRLVTATGVGGTPFGAAVDGGVGFVGDGTSIVVLSIGEGKIHFVRSVPIGHLAEGVALTPGGRYLLAGATTGIVVLDVAKLEQGDKRPVVGELSSPGVGALEVTTSSDGRYVFSTLEGSNELAVYDLQRALTKGFSSADLVGMVPLGIGPVGLALAPGGRYLYATSELEAFSDIGTLTTIDVARAETHPSSAVISTVDAGCSPVRVVAFGQSVYVTARESDALLQFSASALQSPRHRALEAVLRVGEAPVGLAVVDQGRGIVVADSNRFAQAGAASSLALVRLGHGGTPALVGYVRAGSFPRDVSAASDSRQALVAEFGSSAVEAVDVSSVFGG